MEIQEFRKRLNFAGKAFVKEGETRDQVSLRWMNLCNDYKTEDEALFAFETLLIEVQKQQNMQ